MLRLRLASLALCSAAAAGGPALTDPRPLGPGDTPQPTLDSLRGVSRPHGASAVIDERPLNSSSGAVVVGRGGPLFMYDDLENLALEPQVLHGQTGNAIWSDASITGSSRWLGTTVATRRAYAVNTAVGGNTTKKARLMATTAITPDQFFFGLRYELLRATDPLQRMTLFPTPANPVQLEHDLFVTSLNTMWTSEPIHVGSGLIVNRILWGGTCVNGCPDIGLPTGPLSYVYVLGINPLFPYFQTLQWIESAPAGEQVGDQFMMPTGRWVRLRHETTSDGSLRHLFDFNDGTGFHLGYQDAAPTSVRVDSLGANGSYEVANSPAYYDNITARGEEWLPPEPPQPLSCGPTDYSDDIEWLHIAPLRDQHPLWYDALSSRADVELIAGDQVIGQSNWVGDDKHRVEFTRTLPESAAAFGDTWTLCEEVRFTGSNYSTVRAFAPASDPENSLVTRLSFGHFDPHRSPAFARRVFVQHNPAYDPIDDEDTADPYLPGPNGNGAIARIGGAATIGDPDFDYYDTGVTFPLGAAQTWCIEVAEDYAMNVTFDGLPLVGDGSGVSIDAFARSISELCHESENQVVGWFDRLYVDDLFLDCVDADCGCEHPVFVLPYLDNLEWAVAGDNIDAHDDDGNPTTPFRWSAASQMPVVSIAGKSKVLRMENIYRDVPQTPGDFALTVQASTLLPQVEPSASRSYAAGGSFKFTDGDTTRAWVIAETGPVPGLFSTSAWLLYSAGTGTLWTLTPDLLDPVGGPLTWGDTGRTLADVGVAMNQWFSLVVHRALNGTFIYRINGDALTNSAGAVVRTMPLQSVDGGAHETLGALLFLGGDDLGANPGSILYADNVRAWGLPCRGDTNDDGSVDFADVNAILSAFNTVVPATSSPNVAPDSDGDGIADDDVVGFADLNAALGQFNLPCQ